VDSQTPQFHGWGISKNTEWITCNSKNYLWLPPEYRPSSSAIVGTTIGAGTGTGKVWIVSFTEDKA
jgi:hypothetical protein